MPLPVTRAQWEEQQRLLRGVIPLHSALRTVEANANWLLERLYLPVATGYRLNGKVLPEGVGDEPVNWGDLGAYVSRRGKTWVVCLSEAAVDCPCLCGYVRGWLERWGWSPVEVSSEW